jgi:hypothetical protein
MTTERSPKMGERYTREMLEEDLQRRAEQEHKEAAEREKRVARQAWIAANGPGSEKEFEENYKKLQTEQRRKRVIDADRRAREEMRNGTTSRI